MYCLLLNEAAAVPVGENQWEQCAHENIILPPHARWRQWPGLMKAPWKWNDKRIKCISASISPADGASWLPLPAHRFGFWPGAEDPGHRLQIRGHSDVSFQPFAPSETLSVPSTPLPPAHQSQLSRSQELSSCPSPGSATGKTEGGGGAWGRQGTQVGVHSLINAVLLWCLQGPRCCWQLLNGRTRRDGDRCTLPFDLTGNNWRIESWLGDKQKQKRLFDIPPTPHPPPCNLLLSVAVMNAWLRMRLLPGWKPLSDLVFVLTCSTHSPLLLCGQSQSGTPPLPPVSQFQAFKCTSLFCLTLHHFPSRGQLPSLFLLFHLPVYCPWQRLWKLIFFCLPEALNLNLSSGVIVHLCLFPYDVSVFHFHQPYWESDGASPLFFITVMVVVNSSLFVVGLHQQR